MKIKHFFILSLHLAVWGGWAESAHSASKNAGLGPLELRNQYPVTQQFLSLFPENTETLQEGGTKLTYSIAVANTFVNTQGPSKQITRAEVNQGLTETDFYDDTTTTTGNDDKVRGFSLYLDVESTRQTLEYRHGLTESSELSLDIPFLSFSGGFMDNWIEGVHDTFGVPNSEQRGAYRSLSDRHQYGYYVLRDGEFLYNRDQTFSNMAGEPVIGLKWNLSEGGSALPALTLKLSYKIPGGDRNGEAQLVRSGGVDWGHYLVLSKGYGDWIVYFGDGLTRIGQPNQFASTLTHRFMAIEYRRDEESSVLIQTVTQSSVFPKTHDLSSLENNQEQRNYNMSVPTNLVMAGYKLHWNMLIWEMGFAQDYANYGNETDFVIFLETGMQW